MESTKFSRLCPVEQSNLFVGYGELWSSWLLTLLLTDRGVPNVARLDAREIVILQVHTQFAQPVFLSIIHAVPVCSVNNRLLWIVFPRSTGRGPIRRLQSGRAVTRMLRFAASLRSRHKRIALHTLPCVLLAVLSGAQVLVITGFVCQTHDGIFSILGRNGSDFSATIFANLLNALRVTIWKDVEGEGCGGLIVWGRHTLL